MHFLKARLSGLEVQVIQYFIHVGSHGHLAMWLLNILEIHDISRRKMKNRIVDGHFLLENTL